MRGPWACCAECPLPRLGLGGCLVLRRLVTSASLPASQDPASGRYASTPSPVTRLLWAGLKPLLPQMSGVEGQVPAAADVGLPAGMGSQSRPQSALQGFGYSKERAHTGELRGRGPAEGEGRVGPVCPH